MKPVGRDFQGKEGTTGSSKAVGSRSQGESKPAN